MQAIRKRGIRSGILRQDDLSTIWVPRSESNFKKARKKPIIPEQLNKHIKKARPPEHNKTVRNLRRLKEPLFSARVGNLLFVVIVKVANYSRDYNPTVISTNKTPE